MEAVRRNLQRLPVLDLPLGINIGKNRDTPIERAAEDYLAVLDALGPSGDYFVVNVSSPNTPALRDLQDPQALNILLRRLRSATTKPLLVKIAPDLEPDQALMIARTAVSARADGLILTNTTTDYDLIPEAPRVGGLSGQVLTEKSLSLLRHIAPRLDSACPIISVGGVASAKDAVLRIRLGASLVQLYTALIFEGPGLIREINQGIMETLDRCGANSLEELRGLEQEESN
jgi:dihydroorotate dehydrogenase